MSISDPEANDPARANPLPEPKPSENEPRECADILIVDNDERIVELLAWFLSKRGFSVQGVHSFSEAREVLALGQPDLMLSDLDLGAESALVELPRLAEEGILPPTLVVSGYLNAETTERLTSLPQVLGVLAKPFDFARLEERVVGCLKGLSQAQAGQSAPSSSEPEPSPGPTNGDWVEIQPHPGPATIPSESAGSDRASQASDTPDGDTPGGGTPPSTPPPPAGNYRASSLGSAVR
jgi:CheY-like chemotaxis protein